MVPVQLEYLCPGHDPALVIATHANLQLLRIEQEGAFAGLLNGSPQKTSSNASLEMTQNNSTDSDTDSEVEIFSGPSSMPKQLEPQ
jgi:hypothetical protein